MSYLKGFLVTFRQIFQKRVTTPYPAEKRVKPERLHGRHVLGRYEDGMEKCIGCELCAGVCPANCIYVRGADNPTDNPVSPGERYGLFMRSITYVAFIAIFALKLAQREPLLKARCLNSHLLIEMMPFTREKNF